MKKYAAIAGAFLASILAANFAVAHIGHQEAPGAPHTLPVGFGLDAPSGVYIVGVTLVLRDVLQRRAGKGVTFALILAGAALSALFSPALAIASGVTFLASELVDFALYSALQERSERLAILLSNAVSVVVDSALFLWLAFGSLHFVEGQVVGKVYATIAAFLVLEALRARRRPVAVAA
jgi:uncharacterized PurR-regulated membrane protein YhhQ (DUF165 family)